MRCPSCAFENPPGGKFCSECGTGLPAAVRNAARFALRRQSSAVNVVLRLVRRLPYQLPRHHLSYREKSLASAAI
jgi:hypothetical protein